MEAEGRTPEQDPREQPVAINPDDLSTEAVNALVREFVINEVSQDDDGDPSQHYDSALQALKKGDLTIWYTPATNEVKVCI